MTDKDKSISLEDYKEFLKKKKKKKIKKTQKRLDELDPIKPIPGGGFAPIGEAVPFKKKKNYANEYKKKKK